MNKTNIKVMMTSQIVDNQERLMRSMWMKATLYNNLDGSDKGQFDICNSTATVIAI